MQLETSYRQIFSISVPIMLGSAVQNIIALTDSVFLYHYSVETFRAIGLISVFYLIISAIGYGFSRGGQIIIARRYGENDHPRLVDSFYALLYFELFLALLIFGFIHFQGHWFFKQIVTDEITLQLCLDYLYPRSYGIFFSYLGVILIALYTGIAKTRFILIDVFILASVNIVLNYFLVFGHFGFPEMGIKGAAWASTIAEGVAFFAYILYMAVEKNPRVTNLYRLPSIDIILIKQVFRISVPIVFQVILGLGSWFIFFSIIENMGGNELEISNLVRILYLILSIPTWGFSSGINTLASNLRGAGNEDAVLPVIWKTTFINVIVTLFLSLPVVLFPETALYPLFGKEDMSLVQEAVPLIYLLFVIMVVFSVSAILFNGILGIGATGFGLRIQFVLTVFYLSYIFIVVKFYEANILWAWASEVFYWIIVFFVCIWFLYKVNWIKLSI